MADRVFYRKRGGLAVSGGEPTLQWEGLIALLDAAKAEGISTCLETCGVFPESRIPEVNLEPDYARALAQLYSRLSHCRHIELLPYHPYGLSKSEQLGREGIRYRQPEQEELDAFASILTEKGIPVKLHGSML